MVVLVDAKYFGNILRCARKQQNVKTKDLAKMFPYLLNNGTDTNEVKNLCRKIF